MINVIIGLGNPGNEYKKTRHNAGFMAIDAIAKRLGLVWTKNKKLNCEIAKNLDYILVKPQTYMNNSGQAVQAVVAYFKLNAEDIIVIHDELDIELGKYKISVNSRPAGHNGIRSIIQFLKTKNFKRIRIGIKTQDKENMPTEKFVMQKFGTGELKIVNKVIEEVLVEILNMKYIIHDT